MHLNKTYPQIEELKNKIINMALVFSSGVGFIVYLLSITRFKDTGFELSFATDLIVLMTILGITIYRKKLNIRFKAYVSIGAIYVFFLIDVIKFGVFSADKVLIILIPFSSLLVFSMRRAIGIFVFTVLSFIVLAYFHLSGKLIAPSQDNITLSAWLINILLIVIVAIVVVIIQNNFNFIYTKLISNLEKNNEVISEKERNYREIFNASTDAIFIHDLDGKILDVNSSMLKIYGYEPEDIINISVANLSSQNDGYTADKANEHIKNAIEGKSKVFDWQAKRKNGDFFWVEVALKKTTIGDKERLLAIVRDITEKKEDAFQLELYRNHLKELVEQKTQELEQTNGELQATNTSLAQQKIELVTTLDELRATQQQLIQAEKMASLGILTSGVAHEINNPLNFINGGIVGLENYFAKNLNEHVSEVSPLINAINVGVKRTAAIVTSLNHYSRGDDLPLSNCDINSIIDNCLIMLNNQLKNKVEVQKNYTGKSYTLLGNESKLHQAILNIIANAGQAIENRGTITISTKIKDNTIKISIKDNGCGISKENLNRIFDPFFTTKDPGKGTGLGLSITYNIIKDHDGSIEYESEPGLGTTAIIKLPIKNISNE